MTTLGDVLGAARRSASGFEVWLQDSDPALASRVADASLRTGMSFTQYVRAALADFARFASEEDWATLMSSLRDSDDPGTLCLLAMVDWRLTVRGCESHSFHHAHQHRGGADERPDARPAD